MGKDASIQKGPIELKSIIIPTALILSVIGVLYALGNVNPLTEPHNQITWPLSIQTHVTDSAEDNHTNLFAAISILLSLCLMLFLPFWPGLRESLWPRDEYPLPIDMNYSKDPRYLGKSFRRILVKSLGTDLATADIREVHLSKDETIEIKNTCRIKTGQTPPYTLMVQKEMHTEPHVVIDHDLYVIGVANIGKENSIRTLACDDDIVLGSNSRILRWIDALGKIQMGTGCNLGASCTAVKDLALNHETEFSRLFGNPIVTPGHIEQPLPLPMDLQATSIPVSEIKTIEDITYYRKKSISLKSGTVLNQNVIVKGNLDIAEGVTINGDVRCEGHATIGKKCLIRGNFFSEGPLDVFHDTIITGNIFSQDAVHLYPGVRVGKAHLIKSVIAKKKITLDRNISIYGYVLTEGKGMVI